MNDTSAILPRHDAGEAPAGSDNELPRPWGFLATLGWAVLSFALAVGVILVLQWQVGIEMRGDENDPWFPLQFIIICLTVIAVLAAAARLAGWPVGRYFGLDVPRGRDVVHGFVALVVVIAALEILTLVIGHESVTPFQTDSYRTARAAGVLPLLWLAFVVAAPVGEEIFFRGFVFRGWAASWLGPVLTIVLTSCIFAAAHIQYDWFIRIQTLVLGALFGWLRWRSGSTTLPILLHMTVNFVATALGAFKAEGLI
jgi:uncharacterized protein